MNITATLTFKAHGKRHTITIPHDPSGDGYVKALKQYTKKKQDRKERHDLSGIDLFRLGLLGKFYLVKIFLKTFTKGVDKSLLLWYNNIRKNEREELTHDLHSLFFQNLHCGRQAHQL